MPDLVNTNRFPPGGFQVLIPEMGMKTPFSGSFRECLEFLTRLGQKNRSAFESRGLPLTPEAVETWVRTYNANLLISLGMVDGWVVLEQDASHSAQKKTLLGGAAAALASANAGVSAWMDMFGSKGPVSPELAERRASVCAGCPHNDTKNGLYAYFVKGLADRLTGILGALKDINLKLKKPDAVGVCSICLCPLRAKVFSRPEILRKKLPPEVATDLARLETPCWLKDEMGL